MNGERHLTLMLLMATLASSVERPTSVQAQTPTLQSADKTAGTPQPTSSAARLAQVGGRVAPLPPDPLNTVPGLGSTSANFGNSVVPSIPADFFDLGSDLFLGDVALAGVPIDAATYGEASALVVRTDHPIQPDDPDGTIGTVGVELLALSLVSVTPITVTYDGGQTSDTWDVVVALSDIPAGAGSLTATKTHCNGGTFDMTLPVNPVLTFTKTDDPGEVRVLDAALEGEPPLVLATEDAPWVHTLWDTDVHINAPSDGAFVPGVEEVPGCSGPGRAERGAAHLGRAVSTGVEVARARGSARDLTPRESLAIQGSIVGRGVLQGMDCPTDSLYAQPAQTAGDWWAAPSEVAPINLRFESFSGAAQPICDVHWWGLNLTSTGAECAENPMPFEIKFYEDDGGRPGAEICSYTGAVVGTVVANIGYNVYRYDTYLETCCQVTDGWVSVQAGGDPFCWFWWYSSSVGDSSHCRDFGAGIVCDDTFDLSVCLTPDEPEQSIVPVQLANPAALTWHTVVAPAPPDLTHRARKHRYLTIDPRIDPEQIGALKLELTSMKRCSGYLARACRVDDDCEAAVPGSGTCIQHPDVGTAGPWWVQEPQQEQLACLPGPCGDEDWFARVDSEPYFTTWTLATLHIGDCEIIPVASYEIRACLPPDGAVCGDPLTIGTIAQPFVSPGFRGNYGDVVGPVEGADPDFYFTPPDGYTNVNDISAYVLTKQNYGTPNTPQTHPSWVDLHGLGDGNPPQYILNVSDLGQIKKAFAGDAWTDDPGNMTPGQCP